MCSKAIELTSRALNEVTNAEVLLKIKGFIALFIQTMEVGSMSFSDYLVKCLTSRLEMGLLCLDIRHVSSHAIRQIC